MLGRVYKIVDSQSDDVYIGSTVQKLSVRFHNHFSCTYTSIGKLMREHGKSRYKIILIKEYEVADVKQLHAYEQLWINRAKCINKQSAFSIVKLSSLAYRMAGRESANERSKRYYKANKDSCSEKMKLYYESNKSKILERLNEKFNCECGGKYTFQHKSRHMKTKKHLVWESKK